MTEPDTRSSQPHAIRVLSLRSGGSSLGRKLRRITDLSRFTSLIRLDLSENLLTSCAGLEVLSKSLQHLNLSQNRIESMTPLFQLTKLRVLDMSNNRVVEISSKISSLTSLTELHLDGNQIEDISALVRVQSLRHLSLTDNKIDNYVSFVRSNFPHLEILDDESDLEQTDPSEQEERTPKSWQSLFDTAAATPTKSLTKSTQMKSTQKAQRTAKHAAQAASQAVDISSLAVRTALTTQRLTMHTEMTRLNLLRSEVRTVEMANAKATLECEDSLSKLAHSERLRMERVEAARNEYRHLEVYESESKSLRNSIQGETEEHQRLVSQTQTLSEELQRRTQIVRDLTNRHRAAIESLAMTNIQVETESKHFQELKSELTTHTTRLENVSRRCAVEQESLNSSELKSKSIQITLSQLERELEIHETEHYKSLSLLQDAQNSYQDETDEMNQRMDVCRDALRHELEELRSETTQLYEVNKLRDTAKDALAEARLQWSKTRENVDTEIKTLLKLRQDVQRVSSQLERENVKFTSISREAKRFHEEAEVQSTRLEDSRHEIHAWNETKTREQHVLRVERTSLAAMRRDLKSELSSAAESLALHDRRGVEIYRMGKEFDALRNTEMKYRLEKQNAERQLASSRKSSTSSRDKILVLRRELAESRSSCTNLEHRNSELVDKLSVLRTNEKHRGNRTRRLQAEYDRMRLEDAARNEALLCSTHEVETLKRKARSRRSQEKDTAEEMNRIRTELSEYVNTNRSVRSELTEMIAENELNVTRASKLRVELRKARCDLSGFDEDEYKTGESDGVSTLRNRLHNRMLTGGGGVVAIEGTSY